MNVKRREEKEEKNRLVFAYLLFLHWFIFFFVMHYGNAVFKRCHSSKIYIKKIVNLWLSFGRKKVRLWFFNNNTKEKKCKELNPQTRCTELLSFFLFLLLTEETQSQPHNDDRECWSNRVQHIFLLFNK